MNYQAPEYSQISLVLRDGKVVSEMIRIPAESECCVIDTLRLTMHESTLFRLARQTLIDDADIAREASKLLDSIFGFGISKKLDSGRDFYRDAWEIGDNMGHFAIGGIRQRETVLIAINGRGCLGAAEGWEKRLHDFLTGAACVTPRITRVDLAHDDFEGQQLTVDDFDKAWEEGGFDRYGNRPEPCNFGPWKNGDPHKKGRTFYAGTKSASQLFRGYEKGKQLGSPDSPWVRAEVQFSNHDKVIPLDILIDPSAYFIGAYSVLASYSPHQTPKKTAVVQRNVEANMAHFVMNTKKSYGKFIKLARSIYGDEVLLDMIESDSDEWPERLIFPDYRFTPPSIHEQQKPEVLDFLHLISAAPGFGYTGDTDAFYSPLSSRSNNHAISDRSQSAWHESQQGDA
jgi:phage replication initiation protein